MTSSEVDWILDTLTSAVAMQPADHPLFRVDRGDSELYETGYPVDMATPLHRRTGELQRANFVGVSPPSFDPSPSGSSYDHRGTKTLGVRIEGLTHRKYGHIDPDGADGVVWRDLVDVIREALLAERRFPDAGAADVTYTDLQFANETDRSDDYQHAYRYDFDVLLNGYEDLS